MMANCFKYEVVFSGMGDLLDSDYSEKLNSVFGFNVIPNIKVNLDNCHTQLVTYVREVFLTRFFHISLTNFNSEKVVMNVIKLILLTTIPTVMLVGCGGSGGSDNNNSSNSMESEVFEYIANAPLYLQPYEQVDVTKTYHASVNGKSIKVDTLNGAIQEYSQVRIDDERAINPVLSDCAEYIESIKPRLNHYFHSLTPEQSDLYGEDGEANAKFLGLGKITTDDDNGEQAELLEVSSFRFEPRSRSEDAVYVNNNWSGVIDLHHAIGFSYFEVDVGNNCHISLDSWNISNGDMLR